MQVGLGVASHLKHLISPTMAETKAWFIADENHQFLACVVASVSVKSWKISCRMNQHKCFLLAYTDSLQGFGWERFLSTRSPSWYHTSHEFRLSKILKVWIPLSPSLLSQASIVRLSLKGVMSNYFVPTSLEELGRSIVLLNIWVYRNFQYLWYEDLVFTLLALHGYFMKGDLGFFHHNYSHFPQDFLVFSWPLWMDSRHVCDLRHATFGTTTWTSFMNWFGYVLLRS